MSSNALDVVLQMAKDYWLSGCYAYDVTKLVKGRGDKYDVIRHLVQTEFDYLNDRMDREIKAKGVLNNEVISRNSHGTRSS